MCHRFVSALDNGIKTLEEIVEEYKDDLKCIFWELTQGSFGRVPADFESIKATRAKTTKVGAVLMFD